VYVDVCGCMLLCVCVGFPCGVINDNKNTQKEPRSSGKNLAVATLSVSEIETASSFCGVLRRSGQVTHHAIDLHTIHNQHTTTWVVLARRAASRHRPTHNTQRQQKHAFTNQKNVLQHKKLKPGLVAFYDVWPGNGAGLLSKEKISKGRDMQAKSEEKRTSEEAGDVK